MQTIRIEMQVPDDMDPSTILERAQAMAVEWSEEFDDDSDGTDAAPSVDAIENAVSVEAVA